MTPDNSQDIRLAGTKLGRHPHICAFFHIREEEHKVLLPFIGSILQENPFYVSPDEFLEELRSR
jgi:hypothetical protein